MLSDYSKWQKIFQQGDEDRKSGSGYGGKDLETFISLLLKRYQAVCNSHSVDFVFIYIDSDKKYFLDYFKNSCRDLGIKCVNLADVLLSASQERPLTFSIDRHYNEYTHAVIGESVSDYLVKTLNLSVRPGYVHKWSRFLNTKIAN
jgi:hypothetical protein